MLGGDIVSGFRRSTDKQWRRLAAKWAILQLGAFHLNMLALESDALAGHELIPYFEKFIRYFIAFAMRKEDSVASHFYRIAARNDINKQPARGKPIEGCRHSGGNAYRDASRAYGNEKFQSLGS